MATRVIAVGKYYTSAISTDDGVSWTYGALPEVAGLPLSGGGCEWRVGAGPAGIVAVAAPLFEGAPKAATNAAAFSPTGTTWTAVTLPSTQRWSKPVWVVDRFIIAGQTSSAYSLAGAVWVEVPYGFTVTTDNSADRPPVCVALGDNILVAAGSVTSTITIATSSDRGATWTPQPLRYGGQPLLALARASDILLESTNVDATNDRSWAVTFPYSVAQSLSSFSSSRTIAGNAGRVLGVDSGYYSVYSDVAAGPATWIEGPVTPEMVGAVSSQNATVWTGASFISVGRAGPEPGRGGIKSTEGLVWSLMPSLAPPPNAFGDYAWYDLAVQDIPPAFDGLSDTLQLESGVESSPSQYFASVEEALTVAVSFSCASLFQGAISDMLVMLSDGSVVYPVSASIESRLELQDGGTRGVYDPYDAVNNPTQFIVDTTTGAVSIYTGFDFDQYASVDQDLYGVRADGVYLLRGETDNGVPIDAGLDLGVTTLGTTKAKNIEAVYLGLSTDGSAYVRATAHGQERVYRVVHRGPILRALLAKGVTDRAWGVKIDITGATFADLDVVELFTGVNSRRWTR